MADEQRTDPRQQYWNWQMPPQAVAESTRLGWLDEAVQEGSAWYKSQRGSSDAEIRRALDVIAGRDTSLEAAAYRSKVTTNKLKHNAREIVGTLAKLRPMWGYHSDNAAYKDHAELMNKTTRAWYLESFADLSIKEALQYAVVTRRGWVRPIYRRNMFGTGEGDIRLLTYGSPCVLPVQLPSSGDWQQAYAVSILDEMPVAMAHGMFPSKQHLLRPSASRYWYASDSVRKSAIGNWLRRAFNTLARRGDQTDQQTDLLVPIRYTYVIDLSINLTKAPIPMGEPGSSWAYVVPFIGQQIPVGIDPKSGTMIHRTANENDARLYPNRRLAISSDQAILYDGPAFDWHRMLPLASFSLDAWPWEPLGYSIINDGYDISTAINKIVRGNMDKISSQLDLSLAYDINAVSPAEAKRFDPMQPRGRVGFDGTAVEGKVFQSIIPEEILKVSPESMKMVEYLESTLDSQQAIKDVMALARMRAVGSMDDLEKVMEANGPIIEDMSRSMEPPMRDIGVMVKYLVLQYYTTARVMQYVGADGLTQHIFDYDPSSLVPSHVPGENPGAAEAPRDSVYTKLQRARIFADNLRFFILPHTLHEMQQMVMKLGLIQLRKAGVMIDSQTIAEAWNVPNYGTIPGSTVMERYRNEKEQELVFAAKMKEIAMAEGLAPAGGPPGAAAPGKQPEGRPPSGQAAPALKQKDGGARSTITESK